MGRRAGGRRTLGAVVLAGVLGGWLPVAGAPTASAARAGAGELEWTPCEGGECAALEVPLDHDAPDGETISVALFRVPARLPDQRIGSLVTNPGGPGASGVEELRALAGAYPDEIRDRFDLVSFDPRGTGATIPVDCARRLDPFLELDFAPETKAERRALEAAAKRLAVQCARRAGEDLEHIATVDTVRDLDLLRAALGDDGLSYWGSSYGTYLGALYAQLFPDRVRALVLDGPVDPSLDAVELARGQAQGFEAALTAFFASCAAAPECRFHSDGEPARAYDDLLAELEASPKSSEDGRTFGSTQLSNGVYALLYDGEASAADLAAALAAAASGDVAPMVAAADEYYDRDADGTYGSLQGAYYAISCVDRPPISTAARRSLQRSFARTSPHFGVELLNELAMCSYWRAAPVRAPRIRPRGSAPALVFAATGDPVTPAAQGRRLAEALPGSAFVPIDSSLHAGALAFACSRDVASRYLVDRTLPPAGTECAG
jgi:pimeloyl-ACP methyl ester carboxylesterase